MHRYWFRFQLGINDPHPPGVLAGCGVTAFGYDDAIKILRDEVFAGQELPGIRQQIEDIDVSTLDPDHVLPNMGSPDIRGIWFPKGYQ